MKRTYNFYKSIVRNESFPLAYIDLDLLEKNVESIIARSKEKKIRIASKSLRVPSILRLLLENNNFNGLMTYSGRETVFLSKNGFNDILIAYPVVNNNEIVPVVDEIANNKTKIIFMVDSREHIESINNIAEDLGVDIPVCIDIDMSTTYPGIHFGVFRSPINSGEKALELAKQIEQLDNVYLEGIMGYEAQIAGLADRSPSKSTLINFIIRRLKSNSIQKIRDRRLEIYNTLLENGYKLNLVNGGGTGSVETTREEKIVTEVTVGSGFFSSHLFDYYDKFRHLPAAGYAIEVTRKPKNNIFTCHGGGYVASGSLGIDKLPKPYLPEECVLIENEMAGEVQTPIKYDGTEVSIGDPIFFRHSKAGELFEHFNEVKLIKNDKIVESVKTYRGEGFAFL